jgi:hypothetical protein
MSSCHNFVQAILREKFTGIVLTIALSTDELRTCGVEYLSFLRLRYLHQQVCKAEYSVEFCNLFVSSVCVKFLVKEFLKMWMYFVAAAPFVWVIILVSSLINCPASKITMSNFFGRCRQQAVYNAIGMRANIDDMVKRRRNRFGMYIQKRL